ncbi:hypothetical protein H310_02016 [Aphanomyces invadans]|uniref:Uncharacterized protein n=1 Tax=Aphanomyces invadans TaxID=157072 RepID=A0A024UMX0_9STRA|nr:hypothetical protein H310_02016 [Aphanomyces invadans]ETW07515.1 hypothetical protein H310_02016 [Aphanomyces invadans]|eukprot:XP_008863608.1 hypothetical protein H310_02016 [Aphanomyces invadans]
MCLNRLSLKRFLDFQRHVHGYEYRDLLIMKKNQEMRNAPVPLEGFATYRCIMKHWRAEVPLKRQDGYVERRGCRRGRHAQNQDKPSDGHDFMVDLGVDAALV